MLRRIVERLGLAAGADMARLGRDAGKLFAANLGVALLGLFQAGLLTRALGIGGYGRLALVLAFGGVMTRFLSVGLADLVVRYLGEWYGRGSARAAALLRLAQCIALANALLLFGIVFAAAPLVARWVVQDPAATPALRVWAVGVAVLSTSETWLAVLRVRGRYGDISRARIVESAAKVAAIWTVLRFTSDLAAVMGALVGAAAVGSLLVHVAGYRAVRAVGPFLRAPLAPLAASRAAMMTLLRNMWWGSTIKTAATELDQIFLGLLASPEVVGLYRLCLQLVGLIGMLRGPVTEVAYPAVVRKVVGGDRAEARAYLRTLSLVFGGFAACIGVVAFMAAPFLVRTIAGPAFAPSATGFRIMIWADVVTLAVVWRQALAVGLDRSRILPYSWLATAVVWYGAAPLLVPRYGFPAAAALYAVSRLASHGLFLWMLRGALDGPGPGPRREEPRPGVVPLPGPLAIDPPESLLAHPGARSTP